jgi:GTP-binding nuclear protein Ran
MSNQDAIPTFKCLLVGDNKCGKSSFITSLLSNKIDQYKYTKTDIVNVNALIFQTSIGQIQFIIWDLSGDQHLERLHNRYYQDAECAIVMFDITNQESYDHALDWHHKVKNICHEIPVVFVGNKYDLVLTRLSRTSVYDHNHINHLKISNKYEHKILEPFQYLTNILMSVSKQA